jgi:O-antigen/teichoic acid export membrane protein
VSATHPDNSLRGVLAWTALARRSFMSGLTAGSAAKQSAALVFGLRVASAGLAYFIQIFLARWMGPFEYGIYAYVWTWVVMIGGLADLGFATTAQRFIPAYLGQDRPMMLRGFLCAARWLPTLSGGTICLLCLAMVHLLRNSIPAHNVVPLYLACICIPFFALASVQDGIARSYDWMVLALAPDYLIRPTVIFVCVAAVTWMGTRPEAMVVTSVVAVATAAVALLQSAVLRRRLTSTLADSMQFELALWFKVSLPIWLFAVFYLVLTNVDVVILEYLGGPDQVAVYYAAAKTLSLVAFVSFSVSAVSARRFSAYWACGQRDRIETYLAQAIKWTFWPSLAGAVVILMAGCPLLALFGDTFVDGYGLMFIMAAGLIVQASTGPAEAVLNMLHEQVACAAIYAVSLIFNLICCVLLGSHFGAVGVATAVTGALTLKSLLLFLCIKRKLSLHAFIWGSHIGRAEKAYWQASN